METLVTYVAPGFTALLFVTLATPLLRKMACLTGLVDKPGHRKVHHVAVPLVGGISIFMAVSTALLISGISPEGIFGSLPLLAAVVVIFITGVWDDKAGVKPVYRLLIQMACAYTVASAGIRITSLYGILGVEEIPVVAQYIVTMVVIAGVVNAYNLMDGIDGLLGGLALITSSVFAVVAFTQGATELTMLFIAIVGAVAGFLRYNFSVKHKVFMGDAGSLLLGFILVVGAIRLLNVTGAKANIDQTKILLLICGLFLVPVLDSLRVYIARIMRGVSPFKADKTHLHHLFLFFRISHKKVSTLISMATIFIALIVAELTDFMPVTWAVCCGIILFATLPGLCYMVIQLQNVRINWREFSRRGELSMVN